MSISRTYETFWAAAVPGANHGPTTATTVGVRVTFAIDGWILGAKFYGDAGSRGNNVAMLWDLSTVHLLRARAFRPIPTAGYSPAAWQSTYFSPRLPVAAGQTVLVAVLFTQGFYPYLLNGLASAVTVGDLTAPADTPSARNGMLTTSARCFPNIADNANRYGIDVIFGHN